MKKYNYNLILGVDSESTPVVWHWEQNNALALIGKGGSGKTTNAAYWMSQWACQGVRFLLADPHMEDKQSLYAYTEHLHEALIMPCVKENDDILEYVRYISALGKQRMDTQVDHFPLVLVIDEFTSFVITGDHTQAAATLLLNTVNQYRKVGIRVMLLGQTWGQAVRQVSGLRDAISSSVIHKSSINDAKKFVSFDATAKQANLLTPGKAYYEDEMIWIPRLTGTSKMVAQKRVRSFNYTAIQDTLKVEIGTNERFLSDY